jgi:hypothetical protein
MFARFCTAILLSFTLGLSLHAQDADPPEVTIGERLFLETRFAQFFAANSNGNANAVLATGDPVLDNTEMTGSPQVGPFKGQSMNCRACHLVDEQNATLGNRTYCDYARRSPIPDRGDGLTTTPRNSPPLVNASLGRPGGILLHFDGQFASGRDLAVATLSGRNYGWLPMEKPQAIAHIAHIIRDDDGAGDLASGAGGPYRKVLKGTSADLPAELRLPVGFRIDVMHATDKQIVVAIGRLIEAYMRSLEFSRNGAGANIGSPFDVFLSRNNAVVVAKFAVIAFGGVRVLGQLHCSWEKG